MSVNVITNIAKLFFKKKKKSYNVNVKGQLNTKINFLTIQNKHQRCVIPGFDKQQYQKTKSEQC